MDSQADEFYRFGRKIIRGQRDCRNRGKDELREAIIERLPAPTGPEENVEPVMKVAIVGRRNTGKSTFVNTLAQAERMIVSEVPGTTRDSVDVRFELDGKAFLAIDTPGFPPRQERVDGHRFLQHAPRPAEHPPRRRGAVVLRRLAADQQGRQATVRLYRRAVQALRVRGQQVGPAGRQHAHRKMGGLSPRHVPHHVVRADRLHHRPDRPQREGPAQPFADALQAIAVANYDRAAQ